MSPSHPQNAEGKTPRGELPRSELHPSAKGIILSHLRARGEKRKEKKCITLECGGVDTSMSQDTLPSPLAIGCLTKYYYGTPIK